MKRLAVYPLVALFIVNVQAVSADYQDGLNAYAWGDFDKAMQEWREVAEGPADAVVPTIYAETHYAIAMLYWRGEGVDRDYQEALNWLTRAADLGHAGAQAKIGFMHTDGLGVKQDYGKAFDWFSRAAKGGSVDGMYNLGIFYLYGWGTEPDRTMAKQYLATASALGYSAAEDGLQILQAEEERLAALEEAVLTPVVVSALTGEDAPTLDPDIENDALFAKKNDIKQEEEPIISEITEPAEVSLSVGDAAWILEQDPEHYTIQVMALDSEDSVLVQIEGFEYLEPFAIFSVENGGNPLFVLVQGRYETVEEARAARDAFPRVVQRKDRVWIRRFAMVQKRILEEQSQ